MTEAEQIMKRCQVGTRNYEEANNLHAACYGMIGKLLAQREQEPVALVIDGVLVKSAIPEKFTGHLYIQPLQRTWVGLTDEEIEVLFQTAADADEEVHIRFARAIEAKLKEKNT